MKKLQNNFTTPEQSKRLLALGVPADSADCYHVIKNNYTAILHNELFTKCRDKIIKISKTSYRVEMHDDDVLPCWSVGRLIEIMLLCHISDDAGIMFDKPLYKVSNCTNVEWYIRVLESSIKYGHMDFSKLEE